MIKLYLIPGMGTDHRVFQFLNLPGIEQIYIPFLEPLPKETFPSYALRMAAVIPKNETPVILGLSMGGFIAQEIASQRPVKKIILLSSFKAGQQWQTLLKTIRYSKLTHLLPQLLIKSIIVNGVCFLGLSKQWKKEFLSMINSYSAAYYKFACKELLNWKGVNISFPVVQIHGTKDVVFPIANCKPNYVIKNGSHFMIATHSAKVSKILLKELES